MSRPKQLVSKSEIAKTLKVSRGRVSQLIQRGMPVQQDGRINQAAAVEWYTLHVRPRVKPTGAPARAPKAETISRPEPEPEDDTDVEAGSAPEDYWAVRTRHEKAKADRAELDLAVQQGKLLDAEEITSSWAALGTLVRDVVMSIPSRVVNRLPDEWRRQVSLIVTEETRRALSAISHELSQPAK
jgi:phage terminase Nu1 subunit (DNA packaging protein)